MVGLELIRDYLRPDNVNLASDIISDQIRVSTAAVLLAGSFGHYWQAETWIFSEDPAQRSVQRIHGTVSSDGRRPWPTEPDEYKNSLEIFLTKKARKVHEHIVNNLRRGV